MSGPVKKLYLFLAMLLSIFTSSLVCAAERITVHDLIGVWTASDEGTNHFMTAEQVRRNCQSFKMIIHADLRLEAITYGDDGGFMFWAVAETPCMLKDNIIACKVNVHTKKRMLSKNKPVAWSLKAVGNGLFDSKTLINSDAEDTMYRCDDTVQEASLITSKKQI
ncbi:MAG: hypothetical protein CMK38_00145 [Porticoccaceae bacterium]|nr:hypothetical protein [Porticoccaceae bacterium]